MTHRRATERWTATGAVLAQARTAADYALAERTAGDGLALLADRSDHPAPSAEPRPRDGPQRGRGRRRRR